MPVAEANRAAGGMATAGTGDLREIVVSRFDESIAAAQHFFEAHVDAVSSAARDMAWHFSLGGRLLVFGEGADATDAQHVSVEFVHPVIVGKRALPAIALTNDVGTMTSGQGGSFARMVHTLGRERDIALGIGASHSSAVAEALAMASSMGMLTVSIEPRISRGVGGRAARHHFLLPGGDSLIAQEVGETLYHVLWELVHLFLEHGVGGGDEGRAIP